MTEECSSYPAKIHISAERSGRCADTDFLVLKYVREATKNLNLLDRGIWQCHSGVFQY